MFGANFGELMILGMIGLLLFGKRLPDVAKNLGKGVSEFKKGLSGFQDEITRPSPSKPSYTAAPSAKRPEPLADLDDAVVAPRFELPTSAPSELKSEAVESGA